jgi:hypothetical protein
MVEMTTNFFMPRSIEEFPLDTPEPGRWTAANDRLRLELEVDPGGYTAHQIYAGAAKWLRRMAVYSPRLNVFHDAVRLELTWGVESGEEARRVTRISLAPCSVSVG